MQRTGCGAKAGSLPRLRFPIDECCPLPLAAGLRELEHDVIHVLNENRGQSDVRQAELALATDRILVTADYDFGELAMARNQPFVGLVIIAPRPTGLRPVAAALARQIDAMGETVLGNLSLIELDKVRRRPLPP